MPTTNRHDERQELMNAVRDMTASSMASQSITPATAPTESSSATPKYIPPSQRRGGSGTPSMMPTTTMAATNNRFDSLKEEK